MATVVHAQNIDFEVTQPFIPSFMGQLKWIQLDSNSSEKSALITGKNFDQSNPQDPLDLGSLKLFSYDPNSGAGTEIFDFDVHGSGASFSVFYENNFIYICFAGEVQYFDVSKRGLRIWRAPQNGNANFIEIFTNPTVFLNNTITNIDIDDDGNTDFLIGGYSDFGFSSNRVLHNNGDGTFSMITSPAVITGGNSGDFQSGYLDNSGKKHLVTVFNSGGQSFGRVFKNQGNGNFVQIFDLTNFSSSPVFSNFPNVEIVDIDNDGLPDISVASLSGTKIYKNLGNLDFQLNDSNFTGLPAVDKGVVKYADFNDDGLPDAVVSGSIIQDDGGNSTYASGKILFQGTDNNSGQGNLQFGNPYQLMVPAFEFPDLADPLPLGLGLSDLDFYDVNDDGKMDIVMNGSYGGGAIPGLTNIKTYLFTNTTTMSVDAFDRSKVVMYPNPARGKVSFSAEQGSITAIDIYNMTGRRIKTYTDGDEINIGSLSIGMYLVHIHMNNGTREFKKLIKD